MARALSPFLLARASFGFCLFLAQQLGLASQGPYSVSPPDDARTLAFVPRHLVFVAVFLEHIMLLHSLLDC